MTPAEGGSKSQDFGVTGDFQRRPADEATAANSASALIFAHFPFKRALFRVARLGMPWRPSERSMAELHPAPQEEEQNAQDEDQVGR